MRTITSEQAKEMQTTREPLLNIAVEIGEGRSATILIREHDSPADVALQFALRHGLNEQLRDILED